MIKGNIGEWSEPYVLFKLMAEGKIYLGDKNFNKVIDVYYPIISILRHEQNRDVQFKKIDDIVVITDGKLLFQVPFVEFIENSKICFNEIINSKQVKGTFGIPIIETFLNSFSITSLKAKSKLKNDVTIQIEDKNTYFAPSLGFSVKSQLGQPSTLLNASGATNFTYNIEGKILTDYEIKIINNTKKFADKIRILQEFGAFLVFDKVDNEIFKSNLQVIDYNFAFILSEVLLQYYSNNIPSENTVAKFIEKISLENKINYNLDINPSIYELIMKKFLTDYALGMRAAEVWKRNYQATGGYLIVKKDGELVCYHFYFAKSFEDYLYNNTKLETPDPKRYNIGKVYNENNIQKMKLNLQIRFIK